MSLALFIAFCISLALSIFEMLGGTLSHSQTLHFDGLHLLSDAGSIGFGLWVNIFLRSRKAPAEKVFYDILGGSVGAFLLIVLAIWQLFHIELGTANPSKTIIFASCALGANLLSLHFLHKHHAHGGFNFQAVYTHVLVDCIGSASAILASLLIILTHNNLIDTLFCILLACYLSIRAFKLLSWPMLRTSYHAMCTYPQGNYRITCSHKTVTIHTSPEDAPFFENAFASNPNVYVVNDLHFEPNLYSLDSHMHP